LDLDRSKIESSLEKEQNSKYPHRSQRISRHLSTSIEEASSIIHSIESNLKLEAEKKDKEMRESRENLSTKLTNDLKELVPIPKNNLDKNKEHPDFISDVEGLKLVGQLQNYIENIAAKNKFLLNETENMKKRK